jgi:ABC-type sugar transport system ATPase subunit
MDLLGGPPSNRLPGVLRRRAGEIQCDAGLFEFAVDASEAKVPPFDLQKVDVVIRPQDILLHAEVKDGLLGCQADVILEEDLGAEVVVFLRAGETPLVTVVPYGEHEGTTEGRVTIGVDPAAVAVFAADTGSRLGQGVRHA